ncbi:MAG: SIR2 family protein [Lachnospiraceae bacterium]|nr:SIR2 family protein [Lachnospiraceae bacterium]
MREKKEGAKMDLKDILSCYHRNEERWENLKKLYDNSKIVPFIGAGMSVPIYPQWADAIRSILNCNEKELVELNRYFDKNDYEGACKYVVDTIGLETFLGRMQVEFSTDIIYKSSDERINQANSKQLKEVFEGPVFTTNFDKLLEYYYDRSFSNVYSLSNMNNSWGVAFKAIREYRHNLYKIHGDIDDENSLVFSEDQYKKVYECDEFVNVFKTVCGNLNFLFMGCSLTESDRYIKVLSEVVKEFSQQGIQIKNYAFISLPDSENNSSDTIEREIEEKERVLNKIGIWPIWYPYSKHESISVLLKSLKKNEMTYVFKGDRTGKEKHFNIFSSNIKVQDAFVDNCFECYRYDSKLNIKETISINLKKIVELAEKSNLLFIEGKYGTGKTTLSIRIQLELMKKYKTLFYNVEDFIENKEDIELLKKMTSKCFVIVDGIDKLVDMKMDLRFLDVFCERIMEVSKANNNISFIINSREYYQIDSNKNFDNDRISLYVMFELQRDYLYVVRTIGFLHKERYEDFFNNIKPHISNNSLTVTTIKQWHKKSPRSCQLPLFAYVIGTYYYDKQKEKNSLNQELNLLPDNKMLIYEEFVNNTIRGRFREESIKGTINDGFYNLYELVLRKIAISMIREMRESIDYTEDVSKSQELSIKELYAINVKQFDNEIQQQIGEVVQESSKNEVILSDAINNYFFNIFKSNDDTSLMVRFSDINVMCCFAAAYVYDVIIKIKNFKDGSKFKEEFEKIMQELGMVELQPQVMDFLMYKISDLDKSIRDILLINILKCIEIYNETQTVSRENVKAMLVLYIVFIKFYRRSYKEIQPSNLFKTFYRLCMTAKALNINGIHKKDKHRYLAERYFMDCSFIDYQFKRLNYKYYNFSKSRFICSSFEQCNFLDNEFIGAIIKNCKFKLCTIKTKFEKVIIDEKIEIENSIINKVVFECITTKEKIGTIYLRGCTVLNLAICDIKAKRIRIIFENCILSDITISGCKGMIVEIKECVMKSKISLDANSIVYSENSECFNRAVKTIDNIEDYLR